MYLSSDTAGEVFYPSRVKLIAQLCGCTLVAVVGAIKIVAHTPGGLLWAGFGVLGCLIFLVNLQPEASYLRLNEEGFTYCSLFRAHSVKWSDVAGFGIFRTRRTRRVGWNFVPGYKAQSRLMKVSRVFASFDAMLPDSYGLGVKRLAARMEEARQASQLRAQPQKGWGFPVVSAPTGTQTSFTDPNLMPRFGADFRSR